MNFFLSLHLFLCFLFLLKKHGIWVYFGGNFAFSNEYVKNLNCILIIYFLRNEILTWNQFHNIKYVSNNVFIIFVWTKECDFILIISWFRQQCYCVGYALLFWCVVRFVYMLGKAFLLYFFFFKSVNDLIHSLCIISVHRSLVIFGLTRKCYIDTFLDWFPRIRGIISVSNWQYITPDQQIWTDCCIPTLIGKKHTAILLLCYVIIFF